MVEPPKGVKQFDEQALFAIVNLLETIDRANFFVYGQITYTGELKHMVCANQLWNRYRGWSLRDPAPLPEKQFCERLMDWGYFYNDETHKVESVAWRNDEIALRLTDEFYDWTNWEKQKHKTHHDRFNAASSEARWEKANAEWCRMQDLKVNVKKRLTKSRRHASR